MKKEKFRKSEKILIAIDELSKRRKKKITVEDVAVKLWKLWPHEFCMRGYPNYPNNDIQKHITRLLDNSWVVGGVYGYNITEKGKKYLGELKKVRSKKQKTETINEQPRYVKTEYIRIINSKIFKYYSNKKKIEFLESDLFEFLGTSTRSLKTKDRNVFLTRYNDVVKVVIPFCKKIMNENENAKTIVELWGELSKKFSDLLEEKLGTKK
jgi:hypothetical protein